MKSPIPDDSIEREIFEKHLQQYKIKVNEYKHLLVRSALPNKCILLTEAIELLTSSSQHVDDYTKYGLTSKTNLNIENEVSCVTSANDLAGNDDMFEATLLDHISASNTTILMVEETLNDTNKRTTDHNASGTNNKTKERVFQTDIINDTEFDLNILINTNHDRTTYAFQQLHTNETESDTTIDILEKTVDIDPKGIVKSS
ncbi:unnamed protein product [Rotaria magnacalcarata]|uniref:Uncharacterized protein n=1 Tax=Rotaria magnacalcarata TaxID=392030 RepID=A0A816EWR9_9BILA|nr:unnamed protein product [Rotaria magnacalcarata]CAF2180251.1 unnamed protein product [Rotaria magnacalcarata]